LLFIEFSKKIIFLILKNLKKPNSKMRPILLKGHERSITTLKFSHEGDLLWSASKHPTFVVWLCDNGERLGTYHGHNGAIWSLDIDKRTTRVLSASADYSTKLWDAQTGKELESWNHPAPVRDVHFALGDREFLTITDQVIGHKSTIRIWDVASNSKTAKPSIEYAPKNEAKIIQALWGPLNRNIITANEDGKIIIYDIRKLEPLKTIPAHQKPIMQIAYNHNNTLFISASRDGTAKLFDSYNFSELKTYNTGRPLNSASISPIKDEIIVGGGQSADSVTTTRVDAAQFRIRFYHLIYEEELGSVPGHFGPVNVVSYNPDGRGFASGGEDGYVRLHHFDDDYFEF